MSRSYAPLRAEGDTPSRTVHCPRGNPRYLVDNGRLRSLTTRGLAYRRSKNLDDKVQSIAEWETVLDGVDLGDGWLRTGQKYLPTHVNGCQVLLALVNDEGAFVTLGSHPATDKTFYCARRFGDSKQHECGPHFGPQCPACSRFQQWHDTRRVSSLSSRCADFFDIFVSGAFVAFLNSLTDLGAACVFMSQQLLCLTVLSVVLLVLPQVLCWRFMQSNNLATTADLPHFLFRLKIWEEAFEAWSTSASNPLASALLTLIQIVLQSFPQQIFQIVGSVTLAVAHVDGELVLGLLPCGTLLRAAIAVSCLRMTRSLLRWDWLGQAPEHLALRLWRLTLRGTEVCGWTLTLALTVALARPEEIEEAWGKEPAALVVLLILWTILGANFAMHYALIFHRFRLLPNKRRSAMWAGVCTVASPPLYLVQLRPIRKIGLAMRLVQFVALPVLVASVYILVGEEEEGAPNFSSLVEHLAINHFMLINVWAATVAIHAVVLIVGTDGLLDKGADAGAGTAAFEALDEGNQTGINILAVVSDLTSLRNPAGANLADVAASNPALPAWTCLDDLVRRGIYLQQRPRTILIDLFKAGQLQESYLDPLITAGADVNGIHESGETVVDMLIRDPKKEHDWSMLAALIQRGGRLEALKGTILRDLLQVGNLDNTQCRLLEQAGAGSIAINSTHPKGWRAHDALTHFLENWPRLKKEEGESAVDVASRDPRSREWMLLQDLVKRGIRLDKRRRTAILELLMQGTLDASNIALLVQAGADINGINEEEKTATDICAADPRKPVWRFLPALIAHGGRVRYHKAILPYLMQKELVDPEKIDLLLDAGVDVNGLSSEGVNVIDLALLGSELGTFEFVEHLLHRGACPHRRLTQCIPIVLHMSAQDLKTWTDDTRRNDSKKQIPRSDTEQKINVKEIKVRERTATMVRLLLERKADPNGVSDWGKSKGSSPADVAVKNAQWKSLRVLLEYEARLTRTGKLTARSKKIAGELADSGIKPEEWTKLGM